MCRVCGASHTTLTDAEILRRHRVAAGPRDFEAFMYGMFLPLVHDPIDARRLAKVAAERAASLSVTRGDDPEPERPTGATRTLSALGHATRVVPEDAGTGECPECGVPDRLGHLMGCSKVY